jgi:hypothetical protein
MAIVAAVSPACGKPFASVRKGDEDYGTNKATEGRAEAGHRSRGPRLRPAVHHHLAGDQDGLTCTRTPAGAAVAAAPAGVRRGLRPGGAEWSAYWTVNE